MLFDTPIFFVFLVLVVSIYWKLGHKGQNYFLLIASYFFYGWWDWRFLFLMAGSTLVDFGIAKRIGRATDLKSRKTLLAVSLILNFGFLCYFKYLHFFLDSFSRLVSLLGIHNIPVVVMQIILPPAISFYTFQEVAYIVDVYRGEIKPADSLVDYALFISLFPHLIAGPIQRPSHLLPQVQKPRSLRPGFFFSGCLLIVSGLFRKCVIADSCAILANAAFDGKMGTGWAVPLVGMWAFAFQIYGDFSGYSDIARGTAQLMGFHFMVNFRQPYLATSLQEFWRRWHISLSSWLRDYLYIPLGGSRKGEYRTYINLLTTMLLGGLWHGASWTFVIWGFLHGGALAVERAMRNPRRNIAEANTFQIWLKRIVVFNFVSLAFLIFRAASLGDAIRLIGNLLRWSSPLDFLPAFFFLAFYAFLILSVDLVLERSGEEYVTQNLSPQLQIAGAVAGLLMIAFLSTGGTSAFIYFQF
ncbi:MAG: MBOAT family protein [Acidobacteriia bacterium]|nr:MBOAT family protein [Terriglobia bacterium]